MAQVSVRNCFLCLLVTHLVWAKNNCANQHKLVVKCPSKSKFLCLLLKSKLQPCGRSFDCPCGTSCCSIGCGNYCWSLGHSRTEPIGEIYSNDLSQQRKKRSAIALQPLTPAALAYLQRQQNQPFGFGTQLGPSPDQFPNYYYPSAYHANAPNRFASFPTFFEKPKPYEPPPVAEFLIVGTNKTIRLIRPNTRETIDRPMNSQNQQSYLDQSDTATKGPQPRSASSDKPPIELIAKSTKTSPDLKGNLEIPADKSSSGDSKIKHLFPVDDEKTRKSKKIEMLKKALKELGVNRKVAERVRHQKILEKFLKPKPVKVKLNFHLRVKNESDPHLGDDFPSPVVVDGNAYDFMGRKGARIPYTWSIEYRPRSTSGSEGLAHPETLNDTSGKIVPRSAVSDTTPNEKDRIEDEFDVYIWYNKDQKTGHKTSESQPDSHVHHEPEPRSDNIKNTADAGKHPTEIKVEKQPVIVPPSLSMQEHERDELPSKENDRKMTSFIHEREKQLLNNDELNKRKDAILNQKDKLLKSVQKLADEQFKLPSIVYDETKRIFDQVVPKDLSDLQIPQPIKPETEKQPLQRDVELNKKKIDPVYKDKIDSQLSRPPVSGHFDVDRGPMPPQKEHLLQLTKDPDLQTNNKQQHIPEVMRKNDPEPTVQKNSNLLRQTEM